MNEYQFLDNTASPVFAVNGNTGEISTDIEFSGGAGVLVKPNAFGLRSAADPDAGLFFGGADYQFRGLLGAPVMNININNGNTRVGGGLRAGNSSLNQPGNIRWTGSDFQGYDGSSWASLTTGPAGPQGSQGDSFWTENEGLLSTTQKVAIGTNTIEDEFDFQIDGDVFLNTGEGSLFMGSAVTGNQWEINSTTSTNELRFAGKTGDATSYSIKFRFSEEGDLEVDKDLTVEGKATVENGLVVFETTQFFDQVITQEQILVQPSDIDSVGVQLNNSGNYFSSGSWAFGESDGAGPAVSGDYIMSRSGEQHYIFWTGYLRPVIIQKV